MSREFSTFSHPRNANQICIKFHLTQDTMTNTKKIPPNAGKEVRNKHIWCQMKGNPVPLGNSLQKFLKNPKIELHYDSAISQLNTFPQRIYGHLQLSYLNTHVYYNTSYNRQSNRECSSKDKQKLFSIYVHTHNS